ncbi:phosphotransferase [Mesorhizobium sp. WSM2561]|uniref:phosphotransferase n=1 Tax=Mesorhizobium sp. WSM2561 TaxID=1040985 RepID=UPI0004BC8249|nr:phosphotransferase [Mesorhizobium sp. WSM2561]
MPILEFPVRQPRKRVAFVRSGPPADVKAALESWGYDCFMLSEATLQSPGVIEGTEAVVIQQNPDKPSTLSRDLETFAPVLDYDCRVYVFAAGDGKSQDSLFGLINRLELPTFGLSPEALAQLSGDWYDPSLLVFGPAVHILYEQDRGRLPELIARNPAGRAPNRGLVFGGADLNAERTKLLQRAFADCSSITLFQKTDGLSGVDAYEAFAQFAENTVGGPALYHCFVKVGPRTKVTREFQNYQNTALENIPFHLGPRLRVERCVLGRSAGLITSDFVVGGETLRDGVRDGRGVHAIGHLFNQTLIAWRRAAKVEDDWPLSAFLLGHLAQRSQIPAHRKPFIESCGATHSFEDLKRGLVRGIGKEPVLVGVIHGDLHATNVLVRMNDAIIIDLERVEFGKPLLFDAASLEAGLFIDGFILDKRTVQEILKSVSTLYTTKAFRHDDLHCSASDKSAWFFDSVRQVRMQARQMEARPLQYARILAAVYLKKACNPENLDFAGVLDGTVGREKVRAAAFAIAETIIAALP